MTWEQRCQAGHERHERIVVDTDLGPMTVYDYERYMGFAGYCTGQDDVSRTLVTAPDAPSPSSNCAG